MADSDIFVSNDIELDVDFGTMYVIDQGIVIKVVAKKYDPTKTYVVGEYVIYQEKLYKCNTAIEEPEEFDVEKWNNVLLADEVQIANANIALKANASDVYAKSETYNKTEVNTALASKADTTTTYTKTEVDTALGDKADKSDTYTKTEVDTALSAKANSDDVYAKTDTYSKDDIDTNIYTKSETYNKNEVDGIINNLPAPMIFKGTLGVNGTITTLPTASSDNEGFTYKVITDGTYASQEAKVGDIFTSNGTAWVHIPSGDETFTDTWRSIKVNGTEKLSGSITSGSVDFKNGTNSTAVFDPSDNSIKVNVDGYTQSQVDTKLSAKANQTDVTTALNNKADKSTTYTKTEVNTALALKADKSTTYTKTEVDNLVNLIDTVGPADICTFETTLPEPLHSVLVNVLATGGNGTPDTPIPINGYTEANITRCGVNLWDEEWEVGGLNTSTGGNWNTSDRIRSKNYISIKPSTSIYIKYPTSGVSVNCCFYDANKTFISSDSTVNSAITTPSNAFFMRFATYAQYGTTYNNDISILYPSDTTPAYHPYTGNTYTIAFGQTVYGGVLDVTRGKLHVTHGFYEFDGTETGIVYGQGWRYVVLNGKECPSISGIAIPTDVITNNGLTLASRDSISTGATNSISLTGDTIILSDNTPSGLQVCYKLATPFDIDLTPEVISAVVGTNNVFADCGQTEVKYINSNAEDTVTVMQTVGSASTHNYSTDEQIVGTWIDGSIVYEKCIILNNGTDIQVSNTNWTNTGVTFAGVDKFIDAFGIGNDGSYQGQILAYTDNNILMLQTPRNAVGWVAILCVRYTKSSS